jgi:hypothetical protein
MSLLASAAACGGGDDDTTIDPDAKPPLFEEKPPCSDTAVDFNQGDIRVMMSSLEIGDPEDGFDLDRDGLPDNKLSGAGGLAGSAIDDAFENYELMIPFEFFDMPSVEADECVKFAVYLGKYMVDMDLDTHTTAEEGGDCDDTDAAVNRGLAEVPDNGKDDDCDGLADEDAKNVPSGNTDDADGDGVTIAAGDCDDTVATGAVVGGPDEVCGDGRDNDCDGVADRGTLAGGGVACNPYDDVTPEPMPIDPVSFDDDGNPIIRFEAGSVTNVGGDLLMSAGPSLFQVTLPISDGIDLALKITGTTIEGNLIEDAFGVHIENGRIGGIIEVRTADQVRGIEIEEILDPEDSLADAIFANLLGPVLALPELPAEVTAPYEGCRTPDIDVDGDGREAFCDSNLDDDIKVVDVCIDGDGTVVLDTADTHCTEALDDDGKPRFVDGISVELNFTGTQGGEFLEYEAP